MAPGPDMDGPLDRMRVEGLEQLIFHWLHLTKEGRGLWLLKNWEEEKKATGLAENNFCCLPHITLITKQLTVKLERMIAADSLQHLVTKKQDLFKGYTLISSPLLHGGLQNQTQRKEFEFLCNFNCRRLHLPWTGNNLAIHNRDSLYKDVSKWWTVKANYLLNCGCKVISRGWGSYYID